MFLQCCIYGWIHLPYYISQSLGIIHHTPIRIMTNHSMIRVMNLCLIPHNNSSKSHKPCFPINITSIIWSFWIFPKAWQCNYCALCKIAKLFGKGNKCYGRTRICDITIMAWIHLPCYISQCLRIIHHTPINRIMTNQSMTEYCGLHLSQTTYTIYPIKYCLDLFIYFSFYVFYCYNHNFSWIHKNYLICPINVIHLSMPKSELISWINNNISQKTMVWFDIHVVILVNHS